MDPKSGQNCIFLQIKTSSHTQADIQFGKWFVDDEKSVLNAFKMPH
jgi:hypothetical protein